MTKIIIQIEKSEDAKLLEAFVQKLGLQYAYQEDMGNSVSDEEWIKSISGSWNDFSETAEEMIALIEENYTMERH